MKEMSRKQWDELILEVDAKMKATDGHKYIHILKARCDYCGRSEKQKGKCKYWFQYFLELLSFSFIK